MESLFKDPLISNLELKYENKELLKNFYNIN
jgi:hypothetical protein